jgi:transcription initiation factor IIE alpha subunit
MKHRLYEGIYLCPECDTKYELQDVPATELFCDDCGNPLELEEHTEVNVNERRNRNGSTHQRR